MFDSLGGSNYTLTCLVLFADGCLKHLFTNKNNQNYSRYIDTMIETKVASLLRW